MSLAFLAERQLAISAVRRASLLTSSVFNKLVKNETLTKGDKSPVTGTRSAGMKDGSNTEQSGRLCCPGSHKQHDS